MALDLVLASGNPRKARELAALLPADLFSVSPPERALAVEEDGGTFFENAWRKALAHHGATGRPAVADDSGLEVEALPGELGVRSARFGGPGLSDRDRAALLLERMEGAEDRRARFVCVLCFLLGPRETFFFEGRLAGEISRAPAGEGGFGYDPVFAPARGGGRTLAQATGWKDDHSHRARACREAAAFFRRRPPAP